MGEVKVNNIERYKEIQDAIKDLLIAIEALKDIENPMGKLQRGVTEHGYVLNGIMAIQYCSDHNVPKGIAKQALDKIGVVR